MSNAGRALQALRRKREYTCAYCGKSFWAVASHPEPRYCTSQHRKRVWWREQRGKKKGEANAD